MKLFVKLLFLLLIGTTCQVVSAADLVKGTRSHSNGKKSGSRSGSSRHLAGGKGGKGGDGGRNKQNGKCGCSGCTDAVWERDAKGFTCGARIEFLQVAFADSYPTEEDACRRVAGIEFPDICGPCNPASCVKNAKARDQDTTYCGCPECDEEAWALDADHFSCGARITWLLETESTTYPTEQDACRLVAGIQYPEICGNKCNPDTCNPMPGPTRCGCPSCNEDALGVLADGYSCEARIDFLMKDTTTFPTEVDACREIAFEFPNECGPVCNPNTCN
jgi:hypothetical protein